MAALRHDGKDVLITPVDGRWRVEYGDRLAESVYLESAISEALEVDEEHAGTTAARLLDEYLTQAARGTAASNTTAADLRDGSAYAVRLVEGNGNWIEDSFVFRGEYLPREGDIIVIEQARDDEPSRACNGRVLRVAPDDPFPVLAAQIGNAWD